MFKKIKIYLKQFDWIIFAAVMLLILFSLIELYSIALGQSNVNMTNFKKQILFVIIGVSAMFFMAFYDYYNLRNYNIYLYLAGLALLIGVLIFGKVVRGTRGWYDLGGFSLQPVEFAKMFLIIFLARYFSNKTVKTKPIKHLVLTGLGTAIFAFLVFSQPDFGSAALLVMVWLFLITVSGLNLKYILGIILVFAAIGVLCWFFVFADYQKERILTFLDPQANALDKSYNINQAIIAVGAGGLTGRGVGFGSQSQLKFLPEAQNDFIFAVISEEQGLVGVGLVVLFFAVLIYRILSNARKINNDFGVYILVGIAALIFIEMFINIGMNIGIMPVIGISLPFLSYGGSAIISSLMMIGIIESVIIRSKLKY